MNRETKVGDLQLAVNTQEQVLRLDVSVDDVLLMTVLFVEKELKCYSLFVLRAFNLLAEPKSFDGCIRRSRAQGTVPPFEVPCRVRPWRRIPGSKRLFSSRRSNRRVSGCWGV